MKRSRAPELFDSRAAYLNASYCASYVSPKHPTSAAHAKSEDDLDEIAFHGQNSFASLALLSPPSSLDIEPKENAWRAALLFSTDLARRDELGCRRDAVIRHAPFDDAAVPKFPRRNQADELAERFLSEPALIFAHFRRTLLEASKAPGVISDLQRYLRVHVKPKLPPIETPALAEFIREFNIRGLVDATQYEPLKTAIFAVGSMSSRLGMKLDAWSADKVKAGGTFGRYFSTEDVLQRIALVVRRYIDVATHFVDFSCGNNEFGRILKQLRWVGYDIFPPNAEGACPRHFRLKNWFSMQDLPGGLEHRAEALVGLNPPFGLKGITASEFISHTIFLRHPPRLIALITPGSTDILNLIASETAAWREKIARAVESAPHGAWGGNSDGYMRLLDVYAANCSPADRIALRLRARHPALISYPPPKWVVLVYNEELCAGRAFYLPGSRTVDRSFRHGGAAVAGDFASNLAVVLSHPSSSNGAGSGLEGAAESRGIPIAVEDIPIFAIISRGDAIVHPDDAIARKDFKIPSMTFKHAEKWQRYS